MSILQIDPEYRLEYTYGEYLTILEGAELRKLFKLFIKHHQTEYKKHEDPLAAISLSCVFAYQELYGAYVVTQSELRDLSSADARKMDLFYKGNYLLLCKVVDPEDDWESQFENRPSLWKSFNDLVILKPNLFGFRIDINAIFKRIAQNKEYS